MKKLLIALSMLLLSACAGLPGKYESVKSAVLYDGQVAVVLTQKPCEVESVKQSIVKEAQPMLKDGTGYVIDGKKVFKFCWVDGDEMLKTGLVSETAGTFWMMDQFGNEGIFKKSILKDGFPSPEDGAPKLNI